MSAHNLANAAPSATTGGRRVGDLRRKNWKMYTNRVRTAPQRNLLHLIRRARASAPHS